MQHKKDDHTEESGVLRRDRDILDNSLQGHGR